VKKIIRLRSTIQKTKKRKPAAVWHECKRNPGEREREREREREAAGCSPLTAAQCWGASPSSL